VPNPKSLYRNEKQVFTFQSGWIGPEPAFFWTFAHESIDKAKMRTLGSQ
jgi:hypothetical protein